MNNVLSASENQLYLSTLLVVDNNWSFIFKGEIKILSFVKFLKFK